MEQHVDARQLVLRLAAADALPKDRAGLERYLAPLFSKSATEQQRFASVYAQWLKGEEPQPTPVPPTPRPPRRRVRWIRPALKLISALVVSAAVLALWQHVRPRTVEGIVLSPDGQPVPGAEVSIDGVAKRSESDGKFRIFVAAWQLPALVSAKGKDNASGVTRIGEAYGSASGWPRAQLRLRLYATDWSSTISATIRLTPSRALRRRGASDSIPQDAGKRGAVEFVERLDPDIPPPELWHRVDWMALPWLVVPLAAYLFWVLRRYRRRAVLRRRANDIPAQVREVHMPGGIRTLLPGLPLRRLAQELRRRRLIDSNELQADLTISATLRRGGVFTPIRGSRVEPEYLALVDRASLSDHQGLLADYILEDLARSDVLIERYDFDRDATLCRRREPFDQSAQRRAGVPGRAPLQSVPLAELHARHPDHRVLVFSDGAGCFSGFTGEPAEWVETLREWASPVLITPRPPEQWTRREWALEKLGVAVLPLSPSGMLALMGLLGGAPSLERRSSAGARGEALHEQSPARWLERHGPPPATVERLYQGLKDDLGERGVALLAGCAAYPEVHWGITLTLAKELLDQAELERVLPRLARLVWFREAFMPDWLRRALLARISVGDEKTTRRVVQALLETLTLEGRGDLSLIVAVPKSRGLWLWLRKWWRRRRVNEIVDTASPENPVRDLVFLQFVNGERIGRLDWRAPMTLVRTLLLWPRRMVSTPLAAAVIALGFAGAIATWRPPLYLGAARNEPVLLTSDRAGALSVLGVVQIDGNDSFLLVPRISWAKASGSEEHTTDYFDIQFEPEAKSGALSPDGRTLAIGYRDGRVLIFGTGRTGPRHLPSRFDRATVDTLCFNQDGSVLAAAANSRVQVWDVKRGSEIAMFDLASEVTSLALSPDAAQVVIATRGGDVTAFDVRTRAQAAVLSPANLEQTTALAHSVDGRLVAGASASVSIWDAKTGAVVRRFSREPSPSSPPDIIQLAFSPDGRFLSVVLRDTATVWDIATGRPLSPDMPVGEGGGRERTAFVAADRLAVLEPRGTVAIYEITPPPPEVQKPPPATDPSLTGEIAQRLRLVTEIRRREREIDDLRKTQREIGESAEIIKRMRELEALQKQLRDLISRKPAVILDAPDRPPERRTIPAPSSPAPPPDLRQQRDQAPQQTQPVPPQQLQQQQSAATRTPTDAPPTGSGAQPQPDSARLPLGSFATGPERKPAAALGRSFALLFANDFPAGPDGRSASARAQLIARTLETKYGYQTAVRSNSIREGILSDLDQLVRTAGTRDQVIIYLSGLAVTDPLQGYIFATGSASPTMGAIPDRLPTGVTAQEIVRRVAAMAAEEILLIVQTEHAAQISLADISSTTVGPQGTRLLLYSDDESFTASIYQALDGKDEIPSASELFVAIGRGRMWTPHLDRLLGAGDVGGEFRFFRRNTTR